MQNQPRYSWPSLRVSIKAMLVGLLVMLVPAGALVAASQNVKPGITLQISPSSQSIERAKTASYVVTATSTGGFSGAVALNASGLPAGSSASFSPTSVTLSSGSTTTATMNVATTQATPTGTSTIKITGTSGKISGSVTAGLTVNYQVSGSFSMSATPSSVAVPPGATAVYTLLLTRSNFAGPISLSVLGGLPTGAAATFSPNPVTGGSSSLQITTAPSSPNGSYNLYLVGSGQDSTGKTQYAYANVQLVLDSTLKQFALSGNPSGLLAPGTSQVLDLRISNPNAKALSVTNLSVSIKGVTPTAYAISNNLPCTVADYVVTQYSGPYPLSAPPGSNNSLSELGVAASGLPRIEMLDARTNQDGCKGATLQLVYSGSGQGN
ncbi:hypothetical protein J7E83_09010 [Arthrobacter sp. ISL-48]|uniref:COG1470 family protein n=1 Tax=Arthrobacter sp. ISL-48 TaxID=2819110 RepID=UPI001BEA4C4F|nr:hypothetical protein [Arthrobacter sp. ISL-48]MBT2532262.1 hypothetical protein [Arthrobacter sp. ISL-48]